MDKTAYKKYISYEDREAIHDGIRKRLTELMERDNVSFYKISKDLGISKSVYTFLNNKNNPFIPGSIILYKLAKYFDVTMEYILMGDL